MTGKTGLGVAAPVRTLDVLGNSADTSYAARYINPFSGVNAGNRIIQEFVMKNNAGADTLYGAIGAQASSTTAGAERGFLSIWVKDPGSALSVGSNTNCVSFTGKGQIFTGGVGDSGISEVNYKFVSLNGGCMLGEMVGRPVRQLST